MATEKKTTPDYSTMNVYQKLQAARVLFLEEGVKKTGKNMHLEFMYFELADIVPAAERIFGTVGLLMQPTFVNDLAMANVINVDDPDNEPITFTLPFKPLEPITSNSGKQATNAMQALGSSVTYMRRYLWMLVLDIIEEDTIDASLGADDKQEEKKTPAKKTKTPATPAERTEIKETLTSGQADEIQIQGLKAALKKLMELDPGKESMVQGIAVQTKGFTQIDRATCEAMIKKVAEMLKEYTEG